MLHYALNVINTTDIHSFIYKIRGKNFSASFMLIFFIVLFYCSLVLQSNLQSNYTYKKNMSVFIFHYLAL